MGNLKTACNNLRKFFKKRKEIKQDYKPQTTIIKNNNDDLLTQLTKIFKQFRKYFDEWLNNNSRDGNIEKYEKLIYQTGEPELAKQGLEEI